MLIWTLWLLITIQPGEHKLTEVVPASSATPSIVAITRDDSSLPFSSKQTRLPACDDEREEEDEDDSASVRILFHSSLTIDAPLSHAVIAISNRAVQGLELGSRVAILRC